MMPSFYYAVLLIKKGDKVKIVSVKISGGFTIGCCFQEKGKIPNLCRFLICATTRDLFGLIF